MKQRIILTQILAVLVAVVFSGPLGAASSPAAGTRTGAAAVKPPVPSSSTDWEKQWQDTLAAAKQEGEVTVYLNAPSDARRAISDAFFKKFGLKLGVTMGSGSELHAKLGAEYRAGINQVDVIMAGAPTALGSKSQGILSSLDSLLVLPEVKSPRVWLNGRVPFFDKDDMILAYLSVRDLSVVYNADLVKEGELTSFYDLLKPQWKGKAVMFDPTSAGAAQAGTANLGRQWGNEKVYEYLVAMIRQQDALVTRDMRQQVEWVTRGKYLVALWPQIPATNQFLKVGAHLVAAPVKEKGGVTPGNGSLSVPVKPPHPHAATIFLNWFLSREGQALASKTLASHSSRLDVPAEGIHPMFIPKPGDYIQDEESTRARAPFIDGLNRVFSRLNR